jgi:predicted transcriptional regulator of viral defense system
MKRSGGYAELVRAFAQTKPDAGKLTDYCEAIGNNAATERIGFLAELPEKREPEYFVRFARTKVNRTCNLFQTVFSII